MQVDRSAWEFFDFLLNEAGVVCTPGSGFGVCGENHVRISAFNSYDKVAAAMKRIESVIAAASRRPFNNATLSAYKLKETQCRMNGCTSGVVDSTVSDTV